MSSPFDYATAILQTKKQLIIDEISEKAYAPFLVNRALSQHKDCVLFANEMNRRHGLDKRLQNDFLLNTVRSMKRPFAKWAKSEKNDDLECVKVAFGLSDSKAKDALRLLSKEQIQQIKEKTHKGGLGK
jgi:hypothetical protein